MMVHSPFVILDWSRYFSLLFFPILVTLSFIYQLFVNVQGDNSLVAHFEYHKHPITSIEWSPHEPSTLAVSSEDSQLT